jgi:lysophospholipase L1-like esterase
MAALVLGHSFVRRLKDWMTENGEVMAVENHVVHLHGVGGRTIPQVFHRDLEVVKRLRPCVIFLQLGGNDINDRSSAADVFVKLKRLVTVLRREMPSSTIIVGSIFRRKRPRGLSAGSYDRKRKQVNKYLFKEFGAFKRGKKVFFFSHRFFKDWYLGRDGVHLNNSGNGCFFHSILTALRLACDV